LSGRKKKKIRSALTGGRKAEGEGRSVGDQGGLTLCNELTQIVRSLMKMVVRKRRDRTEGKTARRRAAGGSSASSILLLLGCEVHRRRV
jgi:hypothetical protein